MTSTQARIGGLLVAVTLVALAAGRLARSASTGAPVLRVGMIAGETLDWETEQVRRLGLDRELGVRVEPVRLPGKAATEGALLAGDVDVIVDDWLWVARQRALGQRVAAVYPYSLAVGALVARSDGPVRGLDDLPGRRLGIVSPTDKSWLVLRAAPRRLHGFDPQQRAEVVMASPATLSKLLTAGELDAILQYWQHIPRLVVAGRFRPVMGVDDMLRAIGAKGEVPLLVYVARDETLRGRREALLAFLRAARRARAHLASHDEAWGQLGLTFWRARDPLVVAAIRERWRRGLTDGWEPGAADSIAGLFATLLDVGGYEMLGADRLPPGTLRTEVSP